MKFTMRTTKPEAGNKYYIRKADGGWSNAVLGSPVDKDCNVLANCVGYAYGRFNEIGNWGYCKYLAPVNAEQFMSFCNGCEIGQTPKLGACMVWQKGKTKSGSDGAGHVAIVEKVISETEVITSESGYNATKPFWTQTRKKGSDGNWGNNSTYIFLGFIYNPAIDDTVEEIEEIEEVSNDFKIVNIVEKDIFVNQIEVIVDNLRIRVEPGLSSKILGYAQKGIYNYTEIISKDNYIWYKISDNNWIAYNKKWCVCYPKKEKETIITTYTVKKGDSLWKISKKFYNSGLKFSKIMLFNELKTILIHPGDILKIPK